VLRGEDEPWAPGRLNEVARLEEERRDVKVAGGGRVRALGGDAGDEEEPGQAGDGHRLDGAALNARGKERLRVAHQPERVRRHGRHTTVAAPPCPGGLTDV
jgi:hypothetical protein